MTPRALIAEFEAFTAAWEADEVPEQARINAAMQVSRELAPSLDPEHGAALMSAVDDAFAAASAHCDRIASKLVTLQDGKRAVRGYGSLKSHKEGQRIRVKA